MRGYYFEQQLEKLSQTSMARSGIGVAERERTKDE